MNIRNLLIIPSMAITLLGTPLILSVQAEPPPPDKGPKFGEENPGPEQGREPKGKRRPNPEERLARLKEALNLTPEQETKIRAIFETERERMKEQRKENKSILPTKEERKAIMEATRDRIDAAIREVLTPEQQTKFDTIIAEMKARHEKRKGKDIKPDPNPPVPDAPAKPE